MAQELKTRIILRNDSTANWTAQDPVLLKGEVGFDMGLLIFKVGDGVKKWSEITKVFKSYDDVMAEVNNKLAGLHTTDTYQTDVELGADKVAALKTAAPAAVKGDIGVVREALAGGKYQYTAYVNNGTDWVAMDGNYDAANVFFQSDIVATYQFGKYKPDTTGSVTIPASGVSVENLFKSGLAEEKNPTTTQPSATLSSTNIGAKEVGTNIAIAYAFNTDKGKYSYGPDTGVTFSGFAATFNGEEKSGQTGTFTSVQVTDTTNLTITGACNSSEGAIPKTNLGNDYAAGKIAAKSYSPSKGTLTGYRGWFYGYYNGTQAIDNAAAITSDQLRAFGVHTAFPTSMNTNKMQQMFFAAPKGQKSSLSISNAVNGAPLTVTKTSVMVEGANKYDAIEYDLFYVANAVAESGDSKWNIK